MTLPRPKRISRSAFSGALRAKGAVESEHFSLRVGRADKGGIAAVISKKIAKRSVDRHLLKRRMLEVMKGSYKDGRTMIAYARAGSSTLSFHALKQELSSLLNQV